MIYTTGSSIQSEWLIRHCSCMCRQDMFQNFAWIWHRKAKVNPLNHKPFLRKKSPVHMTKNKPAFCHTVTDPRFFDTDSPYSRALLWHSHPWLCLGLPSAWMLSGTPLLVCCYGRCSSPSLKSIQTIIMFRFQSVGWLGIHARIKTVIIFVSIGHSFNYLGRMGLGF